MVKEMKKKNIIIIFIVCIVLISIYCIYKCNVLRKENTSLKNKYQELNIEYGLVNTELNDIKKEAEKEKEEKEASNSVVDKDPEYIEENQQCYALVDGVKIKILPKSKIVEIANNEAKKDKYKPTDGSPPQYSVGINDTNNDYIMGLMSNLGDNILSHWKEDWVTDKYKCQLMWKLVLPDEINLLSTLYLYIDAVNGDVLGGGFTSD